MAENAFQQLQTSEGLQASPAHACTPCTRSAAEGVAQAQAEILLHADAISLPITEWLEREPFVGHVLSVFRGACNLNDSDGRLLALVSNPLDNGPFHIAVPEGKGAFRTLEPGLWAGSNGTTLSIGDRLKVTYKGSQMWDPCPDWERIRRAQPSWKCHLLLLRDVLLTMAPAASFVSLLARSSPQIALARPGRRARENCSYSALRQKARECISRILAALARGDLSAIPLHGIPLAGLGPGLTPSGDDFLVGLMIGLLCQSQTPDAEKACAAIAEAASPRTTLLSAAWLRAAALGQISLRWHTLLEALLAGDPIAIGAAVRNVVKAGATSGADGLLGFLVCCQGLANVLY
jgi:hypothetical protein